MPQPDFSIQRPDLGVIASEMMDDPAAAGYIGLAVMPIFTTTLQASDYPVITLESMLKVVDVDRAMGAGYNRDDFTFSSGTYSTRERGHEAVLDDRERRLYARYFDFEAVTTRRQVGHVLRAQEIRVAAIAQSTANAVGNAAVGTIWSNASAANPMQDVRAGVAAMRAASGLIPNTVVMTWTAFNAAVRTTAFAEQTKYTGSIQLAGEEAQRALLATWFGVDRVLVSNALKDGAKRGQSVSLSPIWTDSKVNLLHIGGNANDLREPTFGRTFLWTGDASGNTVVESYRDEARRADIIRVRHDVDERVVYTGANYILTGAV